MTCGLCRVSSVWAQKMLRRQVSDLASSRHRAAVLLRPTRGYISQRRRIRHAAKGSVQPPGVFDHSTNALLLSGLCAERMLRLHCQSRLLLSASGEIDYENVNFEDMEPLPAMDQNIKPGKGDDATGSDDVTDATLKREEEAWTRREGYLSYFFVRFEHLKLLCAVCYHRESLCEPDLSCRARETTKSCSSSSCQNGS